MRVRLIDSIEGYEEIAVIYDGILVTDNIAQVVLTLTPIKKKLDWLKVDGSVLVRSNTTGDLYYSKDVDHESKIIVKEWQVHRSGGRCPVDPDACIVCINYWNAQIEVRSLAADVDWVRVAQWRFIKLADGYTYA